MKKVGITGGIGSGKSTVCEAFKLLGVHVFHADEAARHIQDNDLNIKNRLTEIVGIPIYSSEGVLDRKALAKLIFNNPELLAKVSSVIHPVVKQQFKEWSSLFEKEDYVLYEAAVLIEGGYTSELDLIILVVADEETRIQRVVNRDQIVPELVKERINNQWTDAEKSKHADYILLNNNHELILPKVLELDREIRAI